MKKKTNIAIFILIILIPAFSIAQNESEKKMFHAKYKYKEFYFEINEKSGNLIAIYTQVGKRYYYFTEFLDTLVVQKQGQENLFSGKQSKIQIKKNKAYLFLNEKPNKKPKKYVLDTVGNLKAAYININRGILFKASIKLSKELNKEFPLQYFSYWNGFSIWDNIKNKDIYYKDFPPFAERLLAEIKDSLLRINEPYVKLTNELLDNISTINYSELKTGLLKLPMGYSSNSNYFRTVVYSTFNKRPELFFKLAEDLPDKKDFIYYCVDDWKTIKKLKTIQTNSSLQKEFIKMKRKEKIVGILFATGYITYCLAFYGGIIYLIVK